MTDSWSMLSDEDRKRWTKPSKCRNEACPYGRPMTITFVGLGQEIPMLCDGCAADEQHAQEEAELEARRQHALEELQRGVREPIRSWSLETFGGESAEASQAFAWSHLVLAKEPRDLYLWGPVGTGKTGLAWSIARELAEVHGVQASFVVWREVLERLRESYDDPTRRPDLRHLRAVPLLVLDDLGAERPTEWAQEQLAGLVDFRNGRLWTIYTSNYPLSDLARRLGKDDEVVGDRIVSRIQQAAIRIHLDGADRRLG